MANKITEQELNSYNSDDITVREKKNLKEKIDARFGYIVSKIQEITGLYPSDFDYDNVVYVRDDMVQVEGYFDAAAYSQSVRYNSIVDPKSHHHFSEYDYAFPTAWMSEDFEDTLKKQVDEYKAKVDHRIAKKEQEKKQYKQDIADAQQQIKTHKDSLYQKAGGNISTMFTLCKPSELIERKKKLADPQAQALEVIAQEIHAAKLTLQEQLSQEEFELVKFKTPEQIFSERQQKKKTKKM